ncbi:MAG: hypothetical protein AB1782_12990 [Cyanobacteriota bacterium]
MCKDRGSGLLDYVLPTAIVGIMAGLSIYYMYSEGMLTKFISASGNIEVENKVGIVGPNTSKASGSSSTAYNESLDVSCVGDSCTINFGNGLVLTDVLKDFGSFVETNGAAITTDKIAAMIEDIANFLDDPATPADEGADFRDLANLYHFVAANQRKVEEVAAICSSDADPASCLNDSINTTTGEQALSLPANLSAMLPGYDNTKNLYNSLINDDLATVRNNLESLPGLYSSYINEDPLYAVVNLYDNIMANPAYSDQIKSITQELYLSVDDVAFQITSATVSKVSYNSISYTLNHRNPLDFNEVMSTVNTSTVAISDVTNPDASNFSDLYSALQCVAGKNVDTGLACH